MKYKVIGKVISGNSIGRELGFPTANILLDEHTQIPDGVWAAEAQVGDNSYRAMVNVGRNPTIGDVGPRRLEAHLFGFEGSLYGSEISVTLLHCLREEKKFRSLDELKEQLSRDKKSVAEYFNTAYPQP